MGDNTNIAPSAWDTAGATGQDALGRAPAKRGEPNGGSTEDAAKEEPTIGARSRAESSVSDSISSETPKAEDAVQVLARMKGLLEWGRTRMEDPSQPVDPAALDSKTSAPASKFQPYGGYDPRKRVASLEPAASEAGSSESTSAKATPDLEQVRKPDAEQQGAEQLAEQLAAEQLAEQLAAEQLAADQLKSEQLVEKLAAEQQAEKSIFNIGTSFVQQKLQEAGQMIRRVADRNTVASTDSSDETSSAAAKASARSWAPPVGYLPKRPQAAQVKQPEIEQTAPSSAAAGEGSEAEIASLQAALDKTKQAAGEYAAYLEGEVESGRAPAGEATQAIQAFDEDERRKEAEIASRQAALDTTKKGEDLAKTVFTSTDSSDETRLAVKQKLEELEQVRMRIASQKKSGIVGMASDNANLVVKQKLKELEQMRENIIARNRAVKAAGADEALSKLSTRADSETR
jgi:hypothetical protein